jgi:hypothetical protein
LALFGEQMFGLDLGFGEGHADSIGIVGISQSATRGRGLSGQHGKFGQDFSVTRIKNSGGDCPMGMSVGVKGVNSS